MIYDILKEPRTLHNRKTKFQTETMIINRRPLQKKCDKTNTVLNSTNLWDAFVYPASNFYESVKR